MYVVCSGMINVGGVSIVWRICVKIDVVFFKVNKSKIIGGERKDARACVCVCTPAHNAFGT